MGIQIKSNLLITLKVIIQSNSPVMTVISSVYLAYLSGWIGNRDVGDVSGADRGLVGSHCDARTSLHRWPTSWILNISSMLIRESLAATSRTAVASSKWGKKALLPNEQTDLSQNAHTEARAYAHAHKQTPVVHSATNTLIFHSLFLPQSPCMRCKICSITQTWMSYNCVQCSCVTRQQIRGCLCFFLNQMPIA